MGFPKISKKGDVRFPTKMGEVGIGKKGGFSKTMGIFWMGNFFS